jgi:hypothetical protein
MPSCVDPQPKWRLPPPFGGPAAPPQSSNARPGLFLPGAFFVAIGAQLLAPLMFVYFAFATFL